MTYIRRVWARLKLALAHPRRRGTLPITIEADGFWFRPVGGSPVFTSWADIREIFGIKLNTIVINDLICVGFRRDDSGEYFSVDELHPEFNSLMEAVEQHFPSLASWQAKILAEPTETKVILYGRELPHEYRLLK